MFPSLDPKKMQSLMKQMGIAQEEIDANRVIIETDDKNIIIENPSVIKIKMQGQTNFQISGDVSEESKEEANSSEEDIKTIIEKTGCSEAEAKNALDKADGDLAEAILSYRK
jgi:nascent polypeptide-associated complex subunit alpha